MIRRSGFALALVLCAAAAARALEVPYLSGRITDDAGILSAAAVRDLSETLGRHEAKTSNQIAVLTVASLEGEPVEDYAVRVAKAWKLGRKGKDNGVLLLVAPRDHRMRIEVGYGLEAALPDIVCGRIIRDEITPAFRRGDFDGGVRAGVAGIVRTLEGGAASGPTGVAPSRERGLECMVEKDLTARILIGAFIFGIIGIFTFIGIVTPDAAGSSTSS